MKDIRYDRQLRLWGEEGQKSIEGAAVCVLGSSALATEILKSLVLAGVHSVCIMDDAVVETADLGNNFFLEESQLGQPRAQAACEWLKELNPSVSVSHCLSDISALSSDDMLSLNRYSVVVGTNLNEYIAANISEALFDQGVPFINCRVYGLLGYVRIAIKEHSIANTHSENARPDLRLDMPFPSLIKMFASIDFTTMTSEEFKHTPYIFIYMKALEEYRKSVSDEHAFPATYSQKKDFQAIINQLKKINEAGADAENFEEAKTALNRSMMKTTVSKEILDIFSSPNCSDNSDCVQPFWLICTGLKQFVSRHGVLPLSGTLPDMTSDSKRYSRLATIYHEKAMTDADEVLQLTRIVEKARGVGDVISADQCYRFCKNARFIQIQNGSCVANEVRIGWQKCLDELMNGWVEEGDVPAAAWYILLRAADRFNVEKSRFPGTNGIPCSIDAFDLRERVKRILDETELQDEEKEVLLQKIPQKAIDEMCRFGAGEPHVAASLLGGIAAQEVIKLATNQYVPLDNTLIIDMHTQKSATLRL